MSKFNIWYWLHYINIIIIVIDIFIYFVFKSILLYTMNVNRKIKNQKAKEWRDNNKDKVKEINKKYWLNKARKELEKMQSGTQI